MNDQTIIDLLDDQWRTVPQIRSNITGIPGHELTTALRRLADAGHIEKSCQITPAPIRGKHRNARRLAIDFFRLKLA